MICPFEVLHFIPLVAIAVVALFARGKFTRVGTSAIVSGLSIIGLVAGGHMHSEHAEPMMLLDPCVGYMVSLVIAFAVMAKELIVVKQTSK
jgi:tetrahydromethanopterin S-methyltransferase subunit D